MRFPRAMPLLIFLLASLVLAISVYAIERSQEQSRHAELDRTAMAITTALERRADANAAYLRADAALLTTQVDITGSNFRRLVAELGLGIDFPGGDGIGWAQRVPRDEIAGFEKTMAHEYPGGVRIYPTLPPDRPYAIPVTFLHPDSSRNRRAIGFDMFSEPARRTAMIAAEENERPFASGKVILMQEGERAAPGFLIYMPVFTREAPTRQLRGYIYAPFNAQDFLDSALRFESSGDFNFRLYDHAIAPERLLAEMHGTNADGAIVTRALSIVGRRWILEVRAADRHALSTQSLLTLLSGLLIVCLLLVVARLLTQQAVEARQAVSWLEQQSSIRASLTRELNHRVKNTLANVLSIVALTRRRATDLDSFAEGLDGRIRALSATHDLLTQSEWGATPIRAVIEVELAPYAKAGEHHLNLSGPDVELAPNDALSLGLAIHELATNAAKYGALSTAGGKVAVSWYRLSDTLARIEWVEAGGPPVIQAETPRGFGTELIEKIVAHELGNPVDLRFELHGVECTLTVPVRAPSDFELRARRAARPLGE